jgi:tRNA (uracil-5-)-methyltransferase TRM9
MEDQKKVWDSISEDWKKFRVKTIEEVEEFLKDKKGNILDLGCGTGRNFVKLNGTIYGVDFSGEMLKHAKESSKEKNIDVKLFESEANDLPFDDGFFDSAIYIAALHCVVSKEEREDSLKELLRVLKPNAEALITVWSKNHKKLVNHPKDSTIEWKTKTESLHRYYYIYDKEELEDLLKDVGFEIVSIEEDNKNIVMVVRKS